METLSKMWPEPWVLGTALPICQRTPHDILHVSPYWLPVNAVSALHNAEAFVMKSRSLQYINDKYDGQTRQRQGSQGPSQLPKWHGWQLGAGKDVGVHPASVIPFATSAETNGLNHHDAIILACHVPNIARLPKFPSLGQTKWYLQKNCCNAARMAQDSQGLKTWKEPMSSDHHPMLSATSIGASQNKNSWKMSVRPNLQQLVAFLEICPEVAP